MSSSPTDAAATAATVAVTMPQMGVSVAEGTIVVWHKRPGDWVLSDETICEITTDKIDTEVPAPVTGRVSEIVVEANETVPVGTVIALISTDAVAGAAHPDEHPSEPAAPSPRSSSPSPSSATAAAAAHDGAHARHYTPVVMRIAQHEGVDLDQVAGTGRDGRVSKQDVLAFVAAREQAPPPMHIESPYRPEESVPVASAPAASAPVPSAPVASTPAASAPAASGAGRTLVEPMSRMRRSIAEHMMRSLRQAAHCTSIVEVDMSAVQVTRTRLGLSPLPIVARCVIDALIEHPAINSTVDGDTLTRYGDVHLGIAVSLGDQGLIVPVVRDAQFLSVQGLAERIADLARRARSGNLSPDDVRGGTFTITNPGGFGTISSTPIINQPQVAILDLEAVVKRPVVVTDASGQDAISIRPMVNLCLSFDHRALDGAQAALFLASVRRRIESWDSSA